eukprot:3036217-Rhodomonas_salina.3
MLMGNNWDSSRIHRHRPIHMALQSDVYATTNFVPGAYVFAFRPLLHNETRRCSPPAKSSLVPKMRRWHRELLLLALQLSLVTLSLGVEDQSDGDATADGDALQEEDVAVDIDGDVVAQEQVAVTPGFTKTGRRISLTYGEVRAPHQESRTAPGGSQLP